MIRFAKRLPCLAVLIGAATLGTPPPVHADFELRYSTDGGSLWTTFTSSSGFISQTVDGLKIQATESGTLGAYNSSLDLSVSGAETTGQNFKLLIQATVTGVPTAPPPEILSWKFTSSSDLSGLTETGQGWVDQSNTAFGTTNIVASTGSLTAPASGSTIFTATPPYSWTEQYSLSGTYTGPDGNISADNNEHITTPEPASVMAALTAVPFLALGAWLRRRKQVAIA